MKTESELTQDILEITNKINHQFPELSKYLKEIPLRMDTTKENGISPKSLSDYYDSLLDVITEYSKTHQKKE
jgi:phage-related tail protein